MAPALRRGLLTCVLTTALAAGIVTPLRAAPVLVFDIGCSPVAVENTDGLVFTVTAENQTLFSQRFDKPRWKPCIVDLSHLAGGDVQFEFSTRAYREPTQYSQGFFGHPRICSGPVSGYDCGDILYDFTERFEAARTGVIAPDGSLNALSGGASARIAVPPVIERAQRSLYLHPKWRGPPAPSAARFTVNVPDIGHEPETHTSPPELSLESPNVLDHASSASHPDCTTDANLPDAPIEVALPYDREFGYVFSGVLCRDVKALDINLKLPETRPKGPDAFAGVVLDFMAPAGLAKRVFMGRFDDSQQRLDWTNPDFAWSGYIQEYEHAGVIHERIRADSGNHTIDLADLAPEGWDGRVWVSTGVQNMPGASVSLDPGITFVTAGDFMVHRLSEGANQWTISGFDGHLVEASRNGRTLLSDCWDHYKQHVGSETLFAAEYGDRTRGPVGDSYTCNTTGLRDIEIHKEYRVEDGCLVKTIGFENTGDVPTVIKHYSGATISDQFRDAGTYYRTGHQDVLGLTVVPADEISGSVLAGGANGRPDEAITAVSSGGMTAGSFRYRINGEWVTPTTSFNWEPTLRYTPSGWQYGSAALWLEPGETGQIKVRYMLTDGGWPEFIRAYRHLPETAAAWNFETPGWVRDVYIDVSPLRKRGFFDLSAGRLATNILWNIPMAWGDYFSEGIIDYGTGETNTARSIAAYLDRVHREAPDERLSMYTFLVGLERDTQTYREHPGFAVSARDGGPDYLGLKGLHDSPAFVRRVAGEAGEYFAAQHAGMVSAYNLDFVYLDGSPAGASRIDWSKGQVTQSSDWLSFYRHIRQQIRAEKPGAALMSNAAGAPYADFSYWEFRRWHTHAQTHWKQIAHALATAKMFDTPGRFIAPTPWRDESLGADNDPEYCNALIGLGMCPSANTTSLDVVKTRWPWVQAAWEMRGSQYSTALHEPGYLSRDDVQIHALQKPGEVLLAVIGRTDEVRELPVIVDAAEGDLQAGAPLFVWMMKMADPREPEGVTGALDRRLVSVRPMSENTKLQLPARPGLLNLYCLTNCPAIVTSVGEEDLQGAQPTVPSVSMLPKWQEERCTVQVSASEPFTAFIPALPGGEGVSARVDEKDLQTQPASVGGADGVSVQMPAGDNVLQIEWK